MPVRMPGCGLQGQRVPLRARRRGVRGAGRLRLCLLLLWGNRRPPWGRADPELGPSSGLIPQRSSCAGHSAGVAERTVERNSSLNWAQEPAAAAGPAGATGSPSRRRSGSTEGLRVHHGGPPTVAWRKTSGGWCVSDPAALSERPLRAHSPAQPSVAGEAASGCGGEAEPPGLGLFGEDGGEPPAQVHPKMPPDGSGGRRERTSEAQEVKPQEIKRPREGQQRSPLRCPSFFPNALDKGMKNPGEMYDLSPHLPKPGRQTKIHYEKQTECTDFLQQLETEDLQKVVVVQSLSRVRLFPLF
ncbi:hypothetical protein lerEdw1_019017 [Lerista edwardsae]|nr:hypothetical protein lerEdw1_019017 [Lerista edwardsae]